MLDAFCLNQGIIENDNYINLVWHRSFALVPTNPNNNHLYHRQKLCNYYMQYLNP